MRDIKTMKIMQIDVTNACGGGCSNCTRMCGHHKKPFFMDVEYYRKALSSLADWPGETVGMIGGEPLLHPEFDKLAAATAEIIGPRRSGLWSCLPFPQVRQHRDVIKSSFQSYCNYNDHEMGSILHTPVLVSARSVMGADTKKMWELIDKCWVQGLWSGTITPKGGFFCEVAGALDMLFDGPGGRELTPGWWRAGISTFKDQMERWCPLCGAAMPLRRRKSNEHVTDISADNLELMRAAGCANLDRVEIYSGGASDAKPHLGWYMDIVADEGALRGAVARRLERERDMEAPPERAKPAADYIEAVLVCKNYADYLSWTLPANARHFDQIIVVTPSSDAETAATVAKVPNVRLVVSDRMHDRGDVFNKGKAVNDGIAAASLKGWVLIMDADIVLPIDFRAKVLALTDPWPLYWSERVESEALSLDEVGRWLSGAYGHATKIEDAPIGYFQLFHGSVRIKLDDKERLLEYALSCLTRRDCVVRHREAMDALRPHVELMEMVPKYPENSRDASGSDYTFSVRFGRERWRKLPWRVLHLPHGPSGRRDTGGNWEGRISPRVPNLLLDSDAPALTNL